MTAIVLSLKPTVELTADQFIDALQPLQQKMQEYISNRVKLGWLINPQDRTVEIYRV